MEEEPEYFLQELRHELTYFQRTKVLTLLDIYIQKNLLPLLDIWLSIASNVPFKMKFYKFHVWDRTLLKTELMEPFQVGNEIKVTYSYKNKFPKLTKMVLPSLDTYPVCK